MCLGTDNTTSEVYQAYEYKEKWRTCKHFMVGVWMETKTLTTSPNALILDVSLVYCDKISAETLGGEDGGVGCCQSKLCLDSIRNYE
jgi:hypothetical protein